MEDLSSYLSFSLCKIFQIIIKNIFLRKESEAVSSLFKTNLDTLSI